MQKVEKHIRVIMALLLLVVLVGQYFVFGVIYVTDTPKFEVFSERVYPLYPIVLLLFRSVFGAELGYALLGLVQNLLLVVGIFSLINFLRSTYQLDTISSLFLAMISVTVFLAQKFFTKSGLISSNALFSEALSIPLYLLFFRYSLDAYLNRRIRPFAASCLLALGLILCRGQLYWILGVVLVNGFHLTDNKGRRAVFAALLACILITGIVEGARYLQTFHIQDKQTRSPLGLYLLTTAVYCSEPDDALLFEEGSGERYMFETIRGRMDDPDNQAAFSYETGDLTNRQKKFERCYDGIKSYLQIAYGKAAENGAYAAVNRMTGLLIVKNLKAFLLHCGQNFLTALIRTVAILRPGINICAGLFYAFLVACSVWLHKKGVLQKEVQFVLLGLLCTGLNAIIMAPGVFALSRYVFYNMPILYFSAVILIRAMFIQICRQAK